MIKEKFDLTGKVAVITGSSKGIGEAIAVGLAEFGASVVVSSRKQEAVELVAGKIRSAGYDATAIECHVAHEEDRKKLISDTIAKYGRIDILVNNAGTNPYFGPIEQMTVEAYNKTMDVNLNSAIHLSNLAYEHMKKANSGSIIHISSVEGIHATKMMAAYNISKAGLIMLGKNQATEWGKYNVRVNVICPGLVNTKLSAALFNNEQLLQSLETKIALGRTAIPEEMAGLACFLASDAASYCTGGVYLNDGGLLLAPLF